MPEVSRTEDPTPQSRCRFAFQWCDITPPADIYHRMWGAARHEQATGVHRPLRASVAVFAPMMGDQRQILVALDHCVMGAVEHANLVAKIAKVSEVQASEILVVFSHTHGAGLMGLDRVDRPGGQHIAPYLDSIGDKVGLLLKQCLSSLQECIIAYGRGRCSLATHRDFYDGTQYVCGHNPGVPVDDTVIVGRASSLDGQTLATIVNYACHPTTLAWDNTLISPDYVGAMREVVERETSAPCLFLQGASGELGPREGFVGDWKVADRNGRELGFAALSAITALHPSGTKFVYQGPVVSGATLGAWADEPLQVEDLDALTVWKREQWSEPLEYRPGQPTAEAVEKEMQNLLSQEDAARTSGQNDKAADLRAMVERKSRMLHRIKQLPQGDRFPLKVVVWEMGDAVWVGVQGEHYSRLQTELRTMLPGRVVVVCTIAADWGASYLPPRELYDTGIYQESIACVAAGSLEQVIHSISQHISA